jgi:hypothetical protein
VQRPQWFEIQYSDGTEGYFPSELALIYYSEQLPSALLMAFDVALPAAVALHARTICSSLTVFPGAVSGSASPGSLINQAAYSFEAQIHIGSVIACPSLLHAKSDSVSSCCSQSTFSFGWRVSECRFLNRSTGLETAICAIFDH